MKTNHTERRVSLQETMNRMASRMDTLLDDQQHDHPTAQKAQSNEIRFWLAVDPLLADLHKKMADAKASRTRIAARHGADDPMTEIADDAADSAQCAVDTRLIELRMNQEARAMVSAMMSKAAADRYDESVEAVRQKTNAFWKDFSRSKRSAEKKGADSFFLMAISVMALRQTLQNANHMLSIAKTFSRASSNDDMKLTQSLAGSA